jgi:hypothetical protein
MTKSSVNFQTLKSALHSVAHSSREVPPNYLLPKEISMGTICTLDDNGEIVRRLQIKLALASRQAKAAKNYSPLFEAVLNLPQPNFDAENFNAELYKKNCCEIVKNWCVEYEKLTGHEVLRSDIHLDEGHVDEAGKVIFNAHAHVMSDRTNEQGKVHIVSPQAMRKIQTMTSNVTKLDRGISSKITRLKHINSHVYKAIAKKFALKFKDQIDDLKLKINDAKNEIKGLKVELSDLKIEYQNERAELKASGKASQDDYQKLKQDYNFKCAQLSARNGPPKGFKPIKKPIDIDPAEEAESTPHFKA